MAEKKKINSSNKGSDYERKVSKVLSKWWGEEFHRTPASGGLKWKEDNRVAGDIVTPVNSKYPYVTELKKREEWLLEQLLKGTGSIEKWWNQVTDDSKRTGMKPFLIFSKNFSPDFGMMLEEDFNKIVQARKNKHVPFNVFTIHKKDKTERLRVLFLLEDFVANFSKEDILSAYSKE